MIRFTVKSRTRAEMIDVTGSVRDALTESGVKNGFCVVFVPHTTAGVIINEGADPSVCRDIITHLSKIAPERGDYRHMEGNSDSHIKVSMTGSSETIIVEDGRLCLGTWQKVFFCEFDGPRTRNVWVQAVGD